MDVMRSEGHSLRRGQFSGCQATGGEGFSWQVGVGQPLSARDKPLILCSLISWLGSRTEPEARWNERGRCPATAWAGCPEGTVQLVLNINFTAAQGRRKRAGDAANCVFLAGLNFVRKGRSSHRRVWWRECQHTSSGAFQDLPECPWSHPGSAPT